MLPNQYAQGGFMNILLKTLFFSFIKKEIISSNLKIGARYEWIVSDDSNYTLQWNNDRTVTLTWDNIILSY